MECIKCNNKIVQVEYCNINKITFNDHYIEPVTFVCPKCGLLQSYITDDQFLNALTTVSSIVPAVLQ